MAHIPVLLNEVIDDLDPQTGETFLDGTVGSAGHALAVASRLGPDGLVIGLDADAGSLAKAKQTLAEAPCRVILKESNFRHLGQILEAEKINHLDLALFDLGFHSDQMTESGRGFSFMTDEPLVMTFSADPKKSGDTIARDIINDWDQSDIENVLVGYGEERYAKQIAEQIVINRRKQPIETTFQLVEAVRQAVPPGYARRKIHFATKTFQALRMATNSELSAITEALPEAFQRLAIGGRLAVITFHSLEAGIIKEFFKDLVSTDRAEFVHKKPTKPKWAEVEKNRRSRSAQLRTIRKIK